jgi:DNA polymerase III subunit beta
MKFTTPAGDFLECLKSVHARCKSSAVEILRHIRFDVDGQQLTMTGHDMSASCEAYLGVDEPGDGSCAVPGDAIVRLVGSMPKAAHITIELAGQQITVKSGKSRYKIPVLKSDDFPDALTCDSRASVQLSAEDVETLFGRTRQALDQKDSRPFGQGLFLHMAEGGLCTSGISLFHFARLKAAATLPELVGVIIPLAAVDEIAKVCKDGGHMTVSDRTIAVEANGRRFCSKLIESEYPDYSRLLPQLVENYVDIDRAETLAAVRRLTSVAEQNSVIDLTIGDREILLSIAGLPGEGIESVQCSSETKIEDVLVSIAAQRFIEMLEMPTGEVLQLHFTKGSMLVRIHDPSDPTFILVESTRIPKGYRAAA